MVGMYTVSFCPADDPALVRLMAAMSAELIALYGWEPTTVPAALGPDARYLLARSDGQTLGCCAVRPVCPVEDGEWELKRMFVDPAARGAGVASGLLEQAEQAVRRFGGDRMRLETGVEQPAAIRLYERSGYRRITNYPPYTQDPVVVCFRKSLTTRGQDPCTLN